MPQALLLLLIVLFLIISSCKSPTEQKLELIKEIKAFEKELGFNETDNFKTYSEELEAYDYYFYTPKTTLPYSLDDPSLQFGVGKPESAPIDTEKYDVFFYSIETIAGVKTPVTKSLLKAPLPRFIHLIFHEDWQEQMDSPLGIEEPCAEVVSYAAAKLFTENKFGRDSTVYKTLDSEFNKKLKESEIYNQYYEELRVLYSRFHSGEISEAETLSRKAELLKAMEYDLIDIWLGKPRQLNNAFIAFQMTYYRHLPLMHQVFSATDSDLTKTMTIFRSVPNQGAAFESLEELKSIETGVTDYLRNTLLKIVRA
ncbi:MAG: hypothetical protein ACE5LA_02670 [Dehalococcoidales bacterium]